MIVAERGRPANVLLSYEEYRRLIERRTNIVAALRTPGQEDIDFEPPPRQKAALRKIDLE